MNIDNAYSRRGLMGQLHTNGWSDAEEKLLSDAAERSKADGTPLRTVFASVAKATGRQPNSVRNHYYMKLKDDAAHGRGHGGAFVPFTDEEVEMLMRTVLTAVARGESVRSCTLRMGNGDNRAMLRYQNKYRAILKKDPELVKRVIRTLESEGVCTADPYKRSEKSAKTAAAQESGEKSDMLRSVESAVEALAGIDEADTELLFRSLGALAAKAAGGHEARPRERHAENGAKAASRGAEAYSADERTKHINALERLYGMLKGLVSLNYGFLSKNSVNKMSHLSEYICELTEQVNGCEQLLSEMRDEIKHV